MPSSGRVPTGWANEVVLDDAAFQNRHRQHAQAEAEKRVADRRLVHTSGSHDPTTMAIAAAAAAASGPAKKRKREPVGDATVLHGKNAYRGPWARFQVNAPTVAAGQNGSDIIEVVEQEGSGSESGTDVEVVYVYEDGSSESGESEQEDDRLARMPISKTAATAYGDEVTAAETTEFHAKDMFDYQGRTYMHVPTDVGINLRADLSSLENFIPKKVVHTWKQHSQSVTQLRFFPDSGHLLLSASADGTVKIFDVYHKRDLLRTYRGHKKSVNDVCFNNDGTRFLSSSYDRQMKVWDTETGACISKFTTGKIPHVARYNPDPEHNHEFLAGMSDKKIVQFDTRSGEQVQEYDHHLGPVNTITFCDENRRFITTSDDKSLRAWEYGIPVPIKFIAEPHMYSMIRAAPHPGGKFVAFQSLDDQIVTYASTDKFRQNRKKVFTGHHVAGYGIDLSFSPDGSILASGDADGKMHFWDWKTGKLRQSTSVSDSAVLAVQWHPRETSKVATGDLHGVIKYWD